jgi:CubicO group peptidase (beta-lactamase class C family)
MTLAGPSSPASLPASIQATDLTSSSHFSTPGGEWTDVEAAPGRLNGDGITRAGSVLFAMGVYGQNLFIDRANKIVIAMFLSQPTDGRALWLSHTAVDEIRGCCLS